MPEREQTLQPPQPPQPPRPPQSGTNRPRRMPPETPTDAPKEGPAADSPQERTSVIDLDAIDEAVPLFAVEGPQRRRHGHRLSREHIERIERRHRRERFLFRLDMVLLIIVCLGGAAVAIGLQALQ